jgi:Restriction Enzyme Adenine Methylase Associated
MSDTQDAKLRDVVRDVISKIRRYQDRNMGEQNTKASLIEPVLEALGWDVRDPDEVFREFKAKSVDSPVDFALTILRKPRLFVEAKGLGETLTNRKWVSQVLSYATIAGVEWCVLSDGDEYRFYNANAPLDAEEKLFWRVKLSEDDEAETIKTLTLISRSNMEENLLDVLWIAHYVDRRVKHTLQELFSTPDKSLIRLIRNREPKLTPKEIVESLRRLDLRFESATPVPAMSSAIPKAPKAATVPKGTRKARIKGEQKGKKHFGISLAKLIETGYLKPPIRLFRKYKSRIMEASLYPDGTVEFQGKRYPTCSTAAEIARSTLTGRRMNTNGWSFWQYEDGKGKTETLLDVRERYLISEGQES